MMEKDVQVIFIHSIGWVLFVFSIVVGGLIALSSKTFEFGIILVFFIFAVFGFGMTRYKRVKKSAPPLKNKVSDTPAGPHIVHSLSKSDAVASPESKGDVFHIVYQDSSGSLTESDIEILKISEKSGKMYIHAFCNISNSIRSFLADRIIEMTENGKKIDIQEYLQQNFTQPPVSLVDDAMKELA